MVPPPGLERACTWAPCARASLPHDVQAEPDAAEPAPVTGLALDEALEDALVIARRDADAFVLDRDIDPVGHRPGANSHSAARWRVLERVLEQLPGDDVGRHRVPERGRQVKRNVCEQRVPVGQGPERDRGTAQQGRQVERAVGDGELVRARSGTKQQLLDQTAKRSGALGDRRHRTAPLGVGQLLPPAR